jgi:hypothetical protein
MQVIVDNALAVCTPENGLAVVVTLRNRRPRPPCWDTPLPNPVMSIAVTYAPPNAHAKVVVDDGPPDRMSVSSTAGFHAEALAETYGLDLHAVHISDQMFDSVCVFTAV